MDQSTPTICQRFGEAVRRARIAADITQEELAERSDVSTRYVQMIERGATEPGLARVTKLAHGLGISGAVLLRRAGL